MTLTKQNIHAALNWGSPNSEQCKILGVSCPLPNDWLRALIGTEMPDSDYERLCALRKKGRGIQDRLPGLFHVEQSIISNNDAEHFANELFEQSGRDLS